MRRGITRANALMALFIASFVAAFLVVGIQKVRTIGARSTCSNNLYAYGFAISNYHEANNRFPPGTMPNPGLPPQQRLSFHVELSPYCEASHLYKLLAKDEKWDSATNINAMQTWGEAKLLLCPGWVRANDPSPTGHFSVTNYVGVAGVGADAPMQPTGSPGIGVFGYERSVTRDDVKDGMSNTALLFETGRDVGPWIRGGPSTIRAVDLKDVPLAGVNRPFGGTHHGAWVMLLADYSVHYMRPDVDTAILAALATIAGGEEITADW